MRFEAFLVGGVILLAGAPALTQSSDPAAARAQLQQGYALKLQGKCDEALPLLVESVRLDRQPKGLVNLADCEEKLGKLAAAQAHFVEVRDLAQTRGLEPLRNVAEQHLAALEKRMPKLVVKLAKDAPTDAIVTRDGVELGRVSLNAPLPTDPGRHMVVVRGNNLERKYEVTVVEAETRELEVTPVGGVLIVPAGGAPPTGTQEGRPRSLPSSEGSTVASSDQPLGEARKVPSNQVSSQRSPLLIPGLVAFGAFGIAGIVTGYVSKSQVDDIKKQCTNQHCPPSLESDATRAETLGTLSTVSFALAGAGLTLSVIALFTGKTVTDAEHSGPRVHLGTRSVILSGAF